MPANSLQRLMRKTDHRNIPVQKPSSESRAANPDGSNTLQQKVVRELTAKALAGSQEVLRQFSGFVSNLANSERLQPHFKAFLALHSICADDIRELTLAAIEANRRLEAGELTRTEAEKIKDRLDRKWESIRLTAELIRKAADDVAPTTDAASEKAGHA
jgi:hypothetical protein